MEVYCDVKDHKNKKRWLNGDTYQGSWQKGLRHGHGTLINTITGEKFVGEFEYNYSTNGILYNADGSIKHTGLWFDDVFYDECNPKQLIYQVVSESYIEYLLGDGKSCDNDDDTS